MTARLLVSALPGETRAAWLEDDALVDLVVQRDDHPDVIGDIYRGRVTRIDRGLAAAFVDIGLAQPGFLPLDEAPGGPLSEGDPVTAKVVRAPGDGKGARLTARLKGAPPDLAALAARSRPPALLARGGDPLTALLLAAAPPEEIVVDTPEAHAAIRARLAEARPALLEGLRLERGTVPLFERAGVEAAIEALLQPRVALPSGGFLLIEPVRSLTAIDVNSGKQDGRGDAQAQALQVDLEAAAAIPRQLRLRGLSGLIVVDFLALQRPAARKEVVAALRRGLKADREPHRVQPMAPSGLVELTRRRSRPALHEILTEPCGLGGGGRVLSPASLAFAALRALPGALAARPGATPAVHALPRVIEALEGPAAEARRSLEARLGRRVELVAEAAMPEPGFDIVLE